ncbi:ABC transporter related [Catenulispora acidiphila DSM 44928]|uniref:ABC transporter related n=1 Tax=Catenulispora acidiphila (strain DSM 44928 / JCM 14897 / NBRC 102108 / NRRL B-24433 / ID139908) TaxID=479433 RepID=C7PY86_CATAD|nr:ABC transporter related [Catenulispora acidiphila DSM 44928]
MRVRRRWVVWGAAAVVAVVLCGAAVSAAAGSTPAVRTQALRITGTPDPDGSPVSLDATLYVPAGASASHPAPAVVLAHGFGGSKSDEDADARFLAQHGYVALAYSARGFGASGGQIAVDSPDYEVRDASKTIDFLASLPEVLKDAPGDPRVGFTGPSYGGALSLLAAGYDHRIDAIAPEITWNDLNQALFPQDGSGPGAAQAGVFKKVWAGEFFGAGTTPLSGQAATVCGRFTAAICAGYQQSATTGVASPTLRSLLAASSPDSVTSRINAPTLLVQGEDDSLFPLSEGDANARQIAAHGTPVKELWYSGGHDGGTDADGDRLRSLTLSWFDRYLKHDGSTPDTAFQFIRTGSALSSENSSPTSSVVTASGPATTSTVTLHGTAQGIVSPPGGNPAAVTGLPGLSGVLGELGSAVNLPTPPGQQATFESAPLGNAVDVVGGPSVSLTVSTDAPDATLFVKLYDAAPDGSAMVLPNQLLAPIRVTGSSTGATIRITLPEIVHDFPAGHRLMLAVSSTDLAYQSPATAHTYSVALAGGGVLNLPDVPGAAGGGLAALWAVAAAVAFLIAALAVLGYVRRRARTREAEVDPELADVPVVLSHLGKAYGGGFRAVTDVSFRVERGQVLGLLGPNGAGKTTALRMLMGLIHPTEGEIRVFGHRITPSASVLSRVGAFVEGPGFLPHLSGRDNLELSWAAAGRPSGDADLEAALELAGLGESIERKVKTYSQGMRQRLAVAQAMLGLPDLLVLDEPTNGLDPPQIREMREALRRYAATGRTVVVSSHLLAEVEQTCTHCVVMARGRLVAQGSVTELLSAATSVAVAIDVGPGESARAHKVLTEMAGIAGVTYDDDRLTVRLEGLRPSAAVTALVGAGLAVERIAPQNRLEDVFLDLVEERQGV